MLTTFDFEGDASDRVRWIWQFDTIYVSVREDWRQNVNLIDLCCQVDRLRGHLIRI